MKTTGGSEDVALKVLKVQDQSSCNDLLSEARVLRYLKHPNLVGWKGIVIKRDQMMLVLEYVNCKLNKFFIQQYCNCNATAIFHFYF